MYTTTFVRIAYDDQQHGDYFEGEEGYIDGYCRGGNGSTYAMVVIIKPKNKGHIRIVMVNPFILEVQYWVDGVKHYGKGK